MDKPRRTFVLVADAGRARLYECEEHRGSAGKLVLVEAFEHPKGRAKNSELMADKPGRAFTGGGDSVTRSAEEYRTEPTEVEAQKFARELSRRLAASFDAHAFDDLVIAAPPKFLGLLRSTLATHHDHVSDRVVAWHDKDFTNINDARDLSDRLFSSE